MARKKPEVPVGAGVAGSVSPTDPPRKAGIPSTSLRRGPAFGGIEIVPLSQLSPHERNSRTHDAVQLEDLKKSMLARGWTIPVLRDEQGTILAGHARMRVAEMLGYTEAPVITARGWSEEEKRSYILADNKLTERGGWNWEMVSEELKFLQGQEFDLSLSGFEDFELDPLLAAQWVPPKGVRNRAEAKKDPDPHGATDGRAITVTIEQYEVIKTAIEKVRELAHDPDMSEGKALEVVAAAYQPKAEAELIGA